MRDYTEPTPPPIPVKFTSSAPSMFVPLTGPVVVEDSGSDISYERHGTWRKAEYGRIFLKNYTWLEEN